MDFSHLSRKYKEGVVSRTNNPTKEQIVALLFPQRAAVRMMSITGCQVQLVLIKLGIGTILLSARKNASTEHPITVRVSVSQCYTGPLTSEHRIYTQTDVW